jgi:SAM-dependent methyltransferase
MNPAGYALAYYHARTVDTLDLLGKLEEDELFGIFTLEVDGRRISRDLLDSVAEITFLERHLQLSERPEFRVLDIGAGYGRLAHRMVEGVSSAREYLCTDGVAASTFICGYYLTMRGAAPRAVVVPVDRVRDTLELHPVDLAVNIHSFSECSLAAITWWMELVRHARVKHLMIVPNSLNNGGTRLLTNQLDDFEPIVERHGYKLVAKEPKYRDPVVQQYAIGPTYYYLFELS